jgi:hypothetical protein
MLPRGEGLGLTMSERMTERRCMRFLSDPLSPSSPPIRTPLTISMNGDSRL